MTTDKEASMPDPEQTTSPAEDRIKLDWSEHRQVESTRNRLP